MDVEFRPPLRQILPVSQLSLSGPYPRLCQHCESCSSISLRTRTRKDRPVMDRSGSELCLTNAMYKHRVKWMFRQTINSVRKQIFPPTEQTCRLLLSLLPPNSKSFPAQLVKPLSMYIWPNIFPTLRPKSVEVLYDTLCCDNHNVQCSQNQPV